MRRSIFNAVTVAAGAVLVAALGVSAHGQISSGIARAGVHGQVVTLHTEKAEVATEARDNEPVEVPDEQETKAPPPPETEAADNDNEAADNDDNDDQGDNSGDSGDSGDTGGD